MDKLIEAEDLLFQASSCIECMWMAAGNTDRIESAEGEPFQGVADVARQKINQAIVLLVEHRNMGAPEPNHAAPSVKPKSPAARTKRSGK